MENAAIPVLIALIAAVTVALAVLRLRADPDSPRGSAPGTGYHTLKSQYQSGLGGQDATWQVPRDPQEYARRFVPKSAAQVTEKKGQRK